MNPARRWRISCSLALFAAVWLAPVAVAQVCQTASDMDASVRAVLEGTAKRYFDMAARADMAALQQNSIPALSASFAGIETAVKDNQEAFTGAEVGARPPFLLVAEGSEPLAQAEFLCGVFGKSGQTSLSTVFELSNLPPAKYGVVILDVSGTPASGTGGATQDARTVTMILQQVGSEWKLGGFYVRLSEAGGHDAPWFAERAREFKTKGQVWNAWLYFRQATILATPVDFMSTLVTDRLYDETHAVQPGELPSVDHPLTVVGQGGGTEPAASQRPPKPGDSLNISKGAKNYPVTQIFPLAIGKDLVVVVKYSTTDVSNTAHVFQDNMAVIRGVVAKFPELRNAFAGVVARGVEPSGRDYGSLLMMRDV